MICPLRAGAENIYRRKVLTRGAEGSRSKNPATRLKSENLSGRICCRRYLAGKRLMTTGAVLASAIPKRPPWTLPARSNPNSLAGLNPHRL
jgi:hypothetical protein